MLTFYLCYHFLPCSTFNMLFRLLNASGAPELWGGGGWGWWAYINNDRNWKYIFLSCRFFQQQSANEQNSIESKNTIKTNGILSYSVKFYLTFTVIFQRECAKGSSYVNVLLLPWFYVDRNDAYGGTYGPYDTVRWDSEETSDSKNGRTSKSV